MELAHKHWDTWNHAVDGSGFFLGAENLGSRHAGGAGAHLVCILGLIALRIFKYDHFGMAL